MILNCENFRNLYNSKTLQGAHLTAPLKKYHHDLANAYHESKVAFITQVAKGAFYPFLLALAYVGVHLDAVEATTRSSLNAERLNAVRDKSIDRTVSVGGKHFATVLHYWSYPESLNTDFEALLGEYPLLQFNVDGSFVNVTQLKPMAKHGILNLRYYTTYHLMFREFSSAFNKSGIAHDPQNNFEKVVSYALDIFTFYIMNPLFITPLSLTFSAPGAIWSALRGK